MEEKAETLRKRK